VKPGTVPSRCSLLRWITTRPVLFDDWGQGLAEYGLIVGFIALVCVAVVVILGDNLKSMLTHVGSSL
jgi:Flp pilus assembly pilin Flp